MNPFSWRYLFHYAATRSREYRGAARCVGDGLSAIEHPNALYLITRGGEEPSRPRNLVTTGSRLRELLRRHELGIRYSVEAVHAQHGAHLGRVNFRTVQVMPDPADVPGTPQIKQWVGFLRDNPEWNARLAGTVVCKPDSDHARGAACDDFDTVDNMRAQYRSAIKWADDLRCKYVIFQETIWLAGPPWTEGSRGEHRYTGDYHGHVHFSARDGQCGVFCSPGFGDCS